MCKVNNLYSMYHGSVIMNIEKMVKEELRTTPVYPHSAAYAREHRELEQYRVSNNANLQCKESIEAAVREHFDGMYLSHDAAKGVIETYGMERVALVLANTVQLQPAVSDIRTAACDYR